jgi:hypothetical protein
MRSTTASIRRPCHGEESDPPGRLIGSRQGASDVLARKRRLTMQMAWKLHRDWGIPAEALIQPARGRTRA